MKKISIYILAAAITASLTGGAAYAAAADAVEDVEICVEANTDYYGESTANEENSNPAEPFDYAEYLKGKGECGSGTIDGLEYYYDKNGYPDYISYVFNTASEMLSEGRIIFCYDVALTENTPANRQAVLDIAAENCCINFIDAQWSYNDRQAALEEIQAMDIKGMQVMDTLNTEWIFVYLPDGADESAIPLHNGLVKILPLSEYANVIEDSGMDIGAVDIVTATDPVIVTGIGGTAETDSSTPMLVWAGIAVIALAAVGGAAVIIRRSRVSVNSDGSAQASASMTKSDVVKLIADSTETPSKELKDRIIKEIDK